MKDTADSGWPTKPLGDLADVLDRLRKPITKKDRKAGPYPYYGATGVLDHVDGYLFDEPLVLIGEDGAKWEAGANSAFAIEGKTWVNNHAHVVRPHRDRVLDDWLIYYLNAADLMPFISGMTVPKLNQGRLREIPIPLPPLEEQQRIVAVLDEAFEGLARARAHAEVSLEDSHEIATRALDVLIADLIERNGRIPVSEIATVKGGKRLPKGEKTSTVETPFPYITVRDFTEDGTVSNEKLGFISEEIQKGIARYTISSQDVYVSIAGTIGKSGIVPDELDGANLTENAAKLVLEDGWSNEYVYWCTRSSDFGAQTAEQTRVAAQPKLALQRLGAITVPKADEAEQVELCEKMASLRSTRSDLVVAYGQKLQDLDDLRQSLLQKAFAGELT